MPRQGRGPTVLNASQKAKLEVVRKRRIDRDNGLEELQAQIDLIKSQFMFERDAALRSAVHEAKDANIPNTHIKRILNITDDRTFKRWLEGYVAPVVLEGWDWELTPGGSLTLTRFKNFNLTFTFYVDAEKILRLEGEELLDGPALEAVIPEHQDDWDELMAEIKEALGV